MQLVLVVVFLPATGTNTPIALMQLALCGMGRCLYKHSSECCIYRVIYICNISMHFDEYLYKQHSIDYSLSFFRVS